MTPDSKDDLTDRLQVLASEQEERLAQYRAKSLSLPYVDLSTFPINTQDLAFVPTGEAAMAQAVLFYKQGKDIKLGAVNPAMPAVKVLQRRLDEHFHTAVQLHVISHRSFESALARYSTKPSGVTSTGLDIAGEAGRVAPTAAAAGFKKLADELPHMSPTDALSEIVKSAVQVDASDVHIEPQEKAARLRFRIDGVLQDMMTFDSAVWKLVLSRIKVMAKLKLNIRDLPQDGSFVLKIGTDTYDVRVSTLPGGWGENIVMRLLNRATEAIKVTNLGMKQRDYDIVMRELKRSNGMILVTGPTGSGKTTTLAAFVMEINQPELKVITLEDPIEYRLPGVEQTQVDSNAGYTFAKGLRSILRQDPDVILVGEIRDVETAEVAVHASLTGHVVFSTLHTNDAPGAIVRLIDMGIKPFVIAPALNLVIAQRLVRVVCAHCAKSYKPEAAELREVAQVLEGLPKIVFDPAVLKHPNLKFKKAAGCTECNMTGYKGRVGIFEVFAVEGEIEELVLQGSDGEAIAHVARKHGMTTILQDGYLKIIEGVTTIEEVKRLTEG